MKRCYLVSYDIRDPKRLRRIFKAMKGYGHHWQYSMFLCNLRALDRVKMVAELHEIANLSKDQILVIDLGTSEESARKAITVIGQRLPEPVKDILVF